MEVRENIDEKYKWDLSCYVKEEDIEKEFEFLDEYKRFLKYNKKFDDREMLLQYLEESKQYYIRTAKLGVYIYNSLNQDTSNTKFIKLSQRLQFIDSDVSQALYFVQPQLNKLKVSYLKELINDERFKNYKVFLQELIRVKKHRIDEKTSKLLSKMNLFLGSAGDCFDELTTSEIPFEDVEVDGNKYQVNEANYSKLLNNKNRDVRRLALKSLMGGYGKFNKTLTSTYVNQCNKDIFFARLEKFKSLKDMMLFYEEVDSKVYSILIEQVNKNLSLLHEVLEEKRKLLNLDKIAYYDIMVELTDKKEYSIEDAIKLVKEATSCLGEEYSALLEEKFNQKVIDYLPNKDKATGAYSTGSYGAPSLVLMNFVGEYDSVSTLAHELGHALHTEFSNRFQPYETSDYVIFVAEVASTVNELLLYNLMMQKADEKTKRALTFELFDQVRSTIFRQTMFSEFEDWTHHELENKRPLTYEDLNAYYYDLNKKYYGENVELPEELKYEWSRIPHFYRPFYVYKYATGLISALCIVQKLMTEKDYYKKYIDFLKGGCSKDPVQLLKDIDVDLKTNKPYKLAFEYIRKQLESIKNNK